MLTIKINTDSAAYDDGDYSNPELRRNLEQIAYELKHGFVKGNVRDINGNIVGEWIKE